jgi:hypothetical protein
MSTTSRTTLTPTQVNQDAAKAAPFNSKDPLVAVTSNEPSEVFLNSTEHPHNISLLKKWIAVCTIGSAALCVTCASSVVCWYLCTPPLRCATHFDPQAAFTEGGVAKEFHVPHEVTILSISLFVEGLGIGPLFFGPLSEVHGRNVVYRVSYCLMFVFSWAVAFAPNIGQCPVSFTSVP